MPVSDKVHVVVRHVNERTKQVCFERLEAQVGCEAITLVSATPFVKVVQLCFEEGLRAGKKWTVCIDADVIPSEDAVARLVSVAEQGPPDLFEAQGLIFDNIFKVLRPAGNHIYRTELLETASEYLNVNKASLRPETATMWSMARAGSYPWWQDACFIGLHDYGQYYRDIVRKIIVQFYKFPHHRKSLSEQFLALRQAGNAEARVALAAIEVAARLHEGDVVVDYDVLSSYCSEVMSVVNLAEKTELKEVDLEYLIQELTRREKQKVTEMDMGFISTFGLRS